MASAAAGPAGMSHQRRDSNPYELHQPYSSASRTHHAQLPSVALQLQPSLHQTGYALDEDDDEEEEERRFRNQTRGVTPEGYYEDIYGQYAQMEEPVVLHDSASPYTDAQAHDGGGHGRKGTIRTLASSKSGGGGGSSRDTKNLKRNQSTSNQTVLTTSSSSKIGSLFGSRRTKNQSISDAATTNGGGANRQTKHSRGLGSSTLPLSSPASRRFGWFPSTWPARLFLLATLAEAAADISIEAVLLSRFHERKGAFSGVTGNLTALPVFFMVFGMAHIYQCFLAVDSIVNRNTILVFGLVIFNLAFLIYALIQIEEIRAVLGDGVIAGTSQTVPVQVLTGAIPVIIGATTLVLAILAYFLWKEFGWQIYKTIGADRRLKRAHLHFQIFVCFLKFDFFTFIAYCLQLVLVVLTRDTAEFWVTTLAAPVTLILLVFAWYSVRTELKWGVVTFMIGLWGGAGYFAYKLFRIWEQKDGPYLEVYKSLTVFSVLALALLLATFVITIRCMMNFDIGLKAAMTRTQKERKSMKEDEMGPVISSPFQYNHLDSPYEQSSQPLDSATNKFAYSPPYGAAYGDPYSASTGYFESSTPYGGGYGMSANPGAASGGAQGLPPSASTHGLLSPTKSPAGLIPLKSSSNVHLERMNSSQNTHRLSLD